MVLGMRGNLSVAEIGLQPLHHRILRKVGAAVRLEHQKRTAAVNGGASAAQGGNLLPLDIKLNQPYSGVARRIVYRVDIDLVKARPLRTRPPLHHARGAAQRLAVVVMGLDRQPPALGGGKQAIPISITGTVQDPKVAVQLPKAGDLLQDLMKPSDAQDTDEPVQPLRQLLRDRLGQ